MTKPRSFRTSPAPAKYSAADEQQFRNKVAEADIENVKFGRDIELAQGERIILRDAAGARYALVITAGAITVTAL